jgi:hypothetical protein
VPIALALSWVILLLHLGRNNDVGHVIVDIISIHQFHIVHNGNYRNKAIDKKQRKRNVMTYNIYLGMKSSSI